MIYKSKRFLSLTGWSIIYGALVLPVVTFGAESYCVRTGDTSTLQNPMSVCSIEQLVEAIAKAATNIGLPIAAMFIIYSGFLFVTAGGDTEKLKTAKTTFMWTMVGTLVLLGAWTIAKAISGTVQSLQ